ILFVSCKDNSKDGNIETPTDETVTDSTMVKETAANLETTSFKIEGMTCPQGCAAVIENKLAGLNGVQDAKVDFDSKTATISFDADKPTTEKVAETVGNIADGAYKVSGGHAAGEKAVYSVEQEQEKETAKKDNKAKKEGCSSEGKSCCSKNKKAN